MCSFAWLSLTPYCVIVFIQDSSMIIKNDFNSTSEKQKKKTIFYFGIPQFKSKSNTPFCVFYSHSEKTRHTLIMSETLNFEQIPQTKSPST